MTTIKQRKITASSQKGTADGQRLSERELPIESDSQTNSFRGVSQNIYYPHKSVFGESNRRKKQGLTDADIKLLEKDAMSNCTIAQLASKYNLPHSTLHAYIRKFKAVQESQKQRKFQSDASRKMLRVSGAGQEREQPEYPEGYQPFVSRKKNSKVRMIERRLVDILINYPNLYQGQIAKMLSTQFNRDISVHVVSRCIRNIKEAQRLQDQRNPSINRIHKSNSPQQEENSAQNIKHRYIYAKEFHRIKPTEHCFMHMNFFSRLDARRQEQTVHVALVLSSKGKVLRWRVSPIPFRVLYVIKIVEDILETMPKYTILLENTTMNQDPRLARVLESKPKNPKNHKNYLYLPPYSPQLNPANQALGDFINLLNAKVQEGDSSQRVVKLAEQSMRDVQERNYLTAVMSSLRFTQMAYSKEPFP